MSLNKFFNKCSIALLPIITNNLFTVPDTLSTVNKILYGVLIYTILLLYSIINIIGYFGFLFISNYSNLEIKYPRIKPVLKYFERTSIFCSDRNNFGCFFIISNHNSIVTPSLYHEPKLINISPFYSLNVLCSFNILNIQTKKANPIQYE